MGKHWDNVYNSGLTPWSGVPQFLEDIQSKYRPLPLIALDIGTGTGEKAHWLNSKGYRVYAIDISEEAIKKAKQKFISNPDIKFNQADVNDIDELGFEPSSIGFVLDLVTSQFLLKDQQKKLFERIREFLAPTGYVAHSRLKPVGEKAPDWVKRLAVSPENFERKLDGFEVVERVKQTSKNLPDTELHRYVLRPI